MTPSRREMLTITAGAALAPAVAKALPRHDPIPHWPPAEHFDLWPGRPPGALSSLPASHPEVTGKPGDYHDLWMRGTQRPDVGVFRPARPDGRAVLIAPGGGYSFVSIDNEGMAVARRLTPLGITCFVLSYRLPGEGWLHREKQPLADAQRAMRLIRANAARYRVDPAKVGVLGFSAGGHLMGSLTTQSDYAWYSPLDVADPLSARPAFAGLIYAVSNMDAGRSHGGSRAQLLGPNPAPGAEARLAVDRNITRDTPPLFILQAQDDDTVPIANGLDLFAAARAAGVKCEAHFLMQGGHGFGVRLPPDNPGSQWTDWFERWSREALAPVG